MIGISQHQPSVVSLEAGVGKPSSLVRFPPPACEKVVDRTQAGGEKKEAEETAYE